jgi:hypothetical protein
MRVRSHVHDTVEGSKAQQPLLVKGSQKLDGEQRIPRGFLVHQLRERPRAFRRAMEGIRDEAIDILGTEGRQHDPAHAGVGLADRLQRPAQLVGGADLVVAVGAAAAGEARRVPDDLIDKIERCGIQPLQVIEKQDERMLRTREHAKEAPQYGLE